MSRTVIPDHLIHHPEEVKRNAQRFDQLCRLAEEVAYPVVEGALVRETAALGVQALTDEAKLALEGLIAESALVELNDPGVLEEVRKSLEQTLPPPSLDECVRFTRDVAEVLMSTWLEILRKDLSSASHLVLSDQLLPLEVSSTVKQLLSRLGLRAPEPFREDGLGALALDEREASHIMKTLRHKLFSEPRLVALPFELVIIGASKGPVFAMTQATCQNWIQMIERMYEQRKQPVAQPVFATEEDAVQTFETPAAQAAAAKMSSQLSADYYVQLSQRAGKAGAFLYHVAGDI